MYKFVTGAIEPTAALVTAALYELARDQNVQNKLRQHLDGVLDEHQQQITLGQLDRLSYLENVLRGKIAFSKTFTPSLTYNNIIQHGIGRRVSGFLNFINIDNSLRIKNMNGFQLTDGNKITSEG